MVLLRQLSNHLDLASSRATCLYLLKHGVITLDVFPELLELPPDMADKAALPAGSRGSTDCVDIEKASNKSRNGGAQSRFEQDFERLELLGRGAFGEVWRCRHRLDRREYAVKAVRYRKDSTDGTDDGQLEQRVAREAQTLAGLVTHPGVLRYHNSWVEVEQTDGADSQDGSLSFVPTNLASEGPSGDISLASGATCLSNPFDAESDGGVTFCDPMDVTFTMEPTLTSSCAAALAANIPEKGGAGLGPSYSPYTTEKKLVKASKQPLATLYIQTELCNNYTLASWIAERNAAVKSAGITCEEHAQWSKGACEIFSQVVDAVAHLHKSGCTHRDIKPSNIFFAADGRIQIGDFGLAKTSDISPPLDGIGLRPVEDAPSATSIRATPTSPHTGALGTPTYASPEQLSGADYGTETDVFALGVILAELLSPVKTQMERSVLLEQFRIARRLPDEVKANYPATARLAIAMVDSDPKSRPALHQLVQIMPKLVCEVQQADCSDDLSVVPQIEEVEQEEQIMCIPSSLQPWTPGQELTEHSVTFETQIDIQESSLALAAACTEAPQQQLLRMQLDENPSSIDVAGGAAFGDMQQQPQPDSQPEHPQPNGQIFWTKGNSDNSSVCRSHGPHRVDVRVLLLFLLCQSGLLAPFCDSTCSGKASSVIQGPSALVSFGTPLPFDTVEWAAAFEFGHDNCFLDLKDMEETHETFIHITSEIKSGTGPGFALGSSTSSSSSSSSDGAKYFAPMYMPLGLYTDADVVATDDGYSAQQLSMNNLFATVYNILSRCTTSAK